MNPVPTPAPTTPYLRWRDVVAWLEGLGINEKEFEKLVRAKVIEPVYLRKGARAFYLRSAIEKHIVAPLRAAEGRV